MAEEVSSIFYSENYFSVCMSEIGGLSALQSLPLKAIGWMTSLSIRLNICGCPGYETSLNSFKCDRGDHQLNCHPIWRVRGYELPFQKAISRQQKAAIIEWERLCRYIALHVAPNRLKLSFVCDASSVDDAEVVIEPLFLGIATLNECAIDLGPSLSKTTSKTWQEFQP